MLKDDLRFIARGAVQQSLQRLIARGGRPPLLATVTCTNGGFITIEFYLKESTTLADKVVRVRAMRGSWYPMKITARDAGGMTESATVESEAE